MPHLARDRLAATAVTAGVAVSYVVSRFAVLTKLPVFCDEGIFIDLAVRAPHGYAFEPLYYGKLLHVWLIALVVGGLPTRYLLLGQ